ncbi:MAG TPA: iron ABC transporter permease [Aggregatilineales bacterium]|nr:iron ABC transporter permease [Anaerolineae bacterium]HUN08621.1 iron ABC transporter permease [Aggregatilineales bacterium]
MAPLTWRGTWSVLSRPRSNRRYTALILPVVIAALVAVPLLLLLGELLTPSVEVWEQLWATTLPRMIGNTLFLLVAVGLGTSTIGVSLAWLVTAYDFPLRRIFDRALLLPLAVPSFVMGFVFMATFDYAGPVQTAWREWFGRGAPFPDIRSGPGAALVLTLVLYPYVYLLARAAFREQGATTFEAARMMGCSRREAFFRLVLPMARPSIVAGATLAMMEAMTDFATVRFFSFPTLSEGVVRVWEGRMDRAAATELASLLLFFALALILLERLGRRGARYDQQGGRGRRPLRVTLTGVYRWGAVLACGIVLGLAFVLPVGQLIAWTLAEIDGHIPGTWELVYGQYILTTVGLAAGAAIITVILSLVLAQGARMAQGRASRVVVKLATLGYAMPGAVVAAGVLLSLSAIDRILGLGLILTGSLVGLLYAYVVRFMAVSYNSVESSLVKVKPSMEQAARIMGAGPLKILRRVHAPLVTQGLAAGAILVFVDVMKELPATMLLRPFGMDTLGIWSYMLASEAFYQAAALPALTILAAGLIPVLILMRVGGER